MEASRQVLEMSKFRDDRAMAMDSAGNPDGTRYRFLLCSNDVVVSLGWGLREKGILAENPDLLVSVLEPNIVSP